MATATPAPATTSRTWLFGPWVDLLLGYGLGYALAVGPLLAVGYATGTTQWPKFAAVAFGLLISTPHYGATIIRAYERAQDRRRYVVFTVWTSLALVAALVAGTHSVLLASVLVTLYMTWAPWHFSGQNYGLAVMALRRRGADVAPSTKRWFYASFVLSSVLAMLAIHMGDANIVWAPETVDVDDVPALIKLGISPGLGRGLTALVAIAYVLSLAVTFRRLARVAAWSELVGVVLLVLTQALWFAIPTLLGWQLARRGTLAFAAVWVSAAHAAQYLWVTAYYAKRADPGIRVSHFLGKTLLAGGLVTVLPGVLLAPSLFGSMAWDGGLAVTLFAVVNLHHFVLDGAIWKLRDGRVARILIASEPAVPAEYEIGSPRRRWGWRSALALGALCLTIPVIQVLHTEFTIKRGTDIDRMQRAMHHLVWIGREGARARASLGRYFAYRKRYDLAASQFERSLELLPTPVAWIGLAELHASGGRSTEALAAYDEALRLQPDHVGALLGSARLRLKLATGASPVLTTQRRDEAIALLEKGLVLQPDNLALAQELARARRLASDEGAGQ